MIVIYEMSTHWGRVTHTCISQLYIIDNGLSPILHQAITWTNDNILTIEPWVTKFSENWFQIELISYKKMNFNTPSAKWQPFSSASIELLHKSQHAPVPYPTMLYFVTEMCTCVHISVTNGALWDISLMHCGICEIGLYPDSKVHGANMGPTWVLSFPGGPHVGPINLAIRVH